MKKTILFMLLIGAAHFSFSQTATLTGVFTERLFKDKFGEAGESLTTQVILTGTRLYIYEQGAVPIAETFTDRLDSKDGQTVTLVCEYGVYDIQVTDGTICGVTYRPIIGADVVYR